MRTFITILFVALLAVAGTAQAQTSPQQGVSVTGKIAEIDLANGTLTLDNGTQFQLAPSFEYTSFPRVGDDVQVTYEAQGGQNVVYSIDGNTNGGNDGGQ